MPVAKATLVTLLVKLGVVASLASILTRSDGVKRTLLREVRTLPQTLRFGLWFSLVFGAGVWTRVATGGYPAGDLGLEGSLLAGILGGYVTGLLSGVLISLPAMIQGKELVTMPLLAAVGVMGGLLRDCASDTEDIWSFSPFIDLNLYRLLRRRTLFHAFFLAAILFAEFLRQRLGANFPHQLFYLQPDWPGQHGWAAAAVYLTTFSAVVLPLKIWNNTRNESKLQEQQRL